MYTKLYRICTIYVHSVQNLYYLCTFCTESVLFMYTLYRICTIYVHSVQNLYYDSLNELERSKLAVWDYPVSDKYTKVSFHQGCVIRLVTWDALQPTENVVS